MATAGNADRAAWLDLAREVETLFRSPMADNPGFQAALDRNIGRGSALCIREGNGPPGSPMVAGMFWTDRHPEYKIGWLAVNARYRRQGAGLTLIDYAISRAQRPAEVSPPDFAGLEVTRDERFTSGWLAAATEDEISALLNGPVRTSPREADRWNQRRCR